MLKAVGRRSDAFSGHLNCVSPVELHRRYSRRSNYSCTADTLLPHELPGSTRANGREDEFECLSRHSVTA